MKCSRCEKTIRYDDGDYCDHCSQNLCDDCMEGGCCGRVPAKSGMTADEERARDAEAEEWGEGDEVQL